MILLGLVATMDLGWRGSCFDGREGFDDRVLVSCPSGYQPEPGVPRFSIQGLTFQVELCAPRDYVPYRLLVSRCGTFEFSTGFLEPKAHRHALTSDEIFLTHFSSRG